MNCLNNDKCREELAWKNPFEVYFRRENNEILRAGAIRDDEIEIQKAKPGTRRDYEKCKQKTKSIRKTCSVYSHRETVAGMYGKTE